MKHPHFSAAVLLDNDTALMDFNENFDFIMNNMMSFDSYPEPMREETLERVRSFYFGEGPIDRAAAFNIIDVSTPRAPRASWSIAAAPPAQRAPLAAPPAPVSTRTGRLIM